MVGFIRKESVNDLFISLRKFPTKELKQTCLLWFEPGL